MKEKKTICFISPFATPLLEPSTQSTGGAERQFVLFGKHLAEDGWQVCYIVKHEKDIPLFEPGWCSMCDAQFDYMGGSKLNLLTGMFSLWKAMLQTKARFFVIKTPAFLLLPMILFAWFFRKKIVFWAQMDRDADSNRNDISKVVSKIQNWYLPWADIVISQTEKQANGFKKLHGINSPVVKSIASRLTSEFHQRQKGKINKRDKFILWCGNSLPKKRQEVLFELARILPDIKFKLAMNVADKRRFDNAEDMAGKLTNVEFLGSVKPAEMEKVFAETYIYVHTAAKEGFPNTFLQAWQAAVPVVSLNIDPDGIIERHGLGFVGGAEKVNSCDDDPHKLARLLVPYIKKILSDEDLRNRIGQMGRDYVQKNHSPEVVVPILTQILSCC